MIRETKKIRHYIYTKRETCINVENTKNGKCVNIFPENMEEDWNAIYYEKADPVLDGWENGNGHLVYEALED